jgi:hypothetical protein
MRTALCERCIMDTGGDANMACEYNPDIQCNCTYDCGKHAKCCECVAYHRGMGQFPACFFSAEAEKKYDRGFDALVRDRRG